MNKIPIEHIKNIIKQSTSIAQVIRACNCRLSGTNYRNVHRIIKEHNINITHFMGQAFNRGRTFPKRRDINDYLSGKQFITTHALKLRLIKDGIKEHKCEICGIAEWCSKPTPIELDHIDGNRNNNQLENLRIVCPNCHAQTSNYRGLKLIKHTYCSCGNEKKTDRKWCTSCSTQYIYIKKQTNHKGKNKHNHCKCGNKKSIKSKLCKKCNNKSPKEHCRKIERPTKEALLVLIQNKPFLQIGKIYGVSDNAVRKWCKSYGLPYKKKDIVKIQPMSGT
jgi:hypothetical protein